MPGGLSGSQELRIKMPGEGSGFIKDIPPGIVLEVSGIREGFMRICNKIMTIDLAGKIVCI